MDSNSAFIIDIPERLDCESITSVVSRLNNFENLNITVILAINFA